MEENKSSGELTDGNILTGMLTKGKFSNNVLLLLRIAKP